MTDITIETTTDEIKDLRQEIYELKMQLLETQSLFYQAKDENTNLRMQILQLKTE